MNNEVAILACSNNWDIYQWLHTRARTNVGTFECLFVYATFVVIFFASKHSLIVFMPDLCANFIQKVPLLL